MGWLLLALLAHALNAVVFIVDKGLLGRKDSAVGHPAWYAAYSGMVSAVAGLLLLVDFSFPTFFMIGWSAVAGMLWMIALWLFFRALKEGEASRVVPITGSSVPIWTALLALFFLGEHLMTRQLVAVFLLIIGGGLLSLQLRGNKGLSPRVLLFAIGSGAAFAAHFAVTKIIYGGSLSFIPAFAYVRLGVGLWAVLLWVVLMRQRSPQRRARAQPVSAAFSRVAAAFIASKVIGMIALLLQNYAIKIGNLTLVNALQGTQYIVVLLLAGVVSVWAPRFFREEFRRVALQQKLAGILCVAVGLSLLVV